MTARVLIVEDDPDWRALWRSHLEHRGAAVVEASDGEEGIVRLAEGTIDVVLLDITMPAADGWHFLRRVHADRLAVPVVVLTGRADEGTELQARELGAAAFVAKPVEAADLLAVVHGVLDRSSR